VKGSQFILEPYKIAKNSNMPTKGQAFEQLTLMCQEYTDNAVFVLDGALRGRRLVSFGGKMREVHKLLNLEDPTKGDLIHTDNEDELHPDLAYVIRTYRWNVEFMNYVLVDLMEASDEYEAEPPA
jgi:plasmid rolling circle replication initiator protein Rep